MNYYKIHMLGHQTALLITDRDPRADALLPLAERPAAIVGHPLTIPEDSAFYAMTIQGAMVGWGALHHLEDLTEEEAMVYAKIQRARKDAPTPITEEYLRDRYWRDAPRLRSALRLLSEFPDLTPSELDDACHVAPDLAVGLVREFRANPNARREADIPF